MTQLFIIGSGGHARVLAEALRACGTALAGFIGTERGGASGVMASLPFVGTDDELLTLGPTGIILVNGVGSIGDSGKRRNIFNRFHAAGFQFTTVIHPSAVVASDVAINEGVQVMAGAIIQNGVHLGINTLINTAAVVDHDSYVGDHTHIAPKACLAADVTVGRSSHVGAGATIIQGIRVGDEVVIAAGAVVIDDVASRTTAMGVPAVIKSSH